MDKAMRSMTQCQGGLCKRVPDEVCEAVSATLQHVPSSALSAGRSEAQDRDQRAEMLAPRMAIECWRFCPCFPEGRTDQHQRIFELVHTDLANRLAFPEEAATALRAGTERAQDGDQDEQQVA